MKTLSTRLLVIIAGTAAAIGVAICIPSSAAETESLLAVSAVDRT
ncbi:hypothetical protein [Streptomyces sp. NPDC094032]